MSDGEYQIPDEYKFPSEIVGMETGRKGLDMLDLIKGNFVYFNHFRQGNFCYHLVTSDSTYSFYVPLDDIGTGTMEHRDKASAYMRWIRKNIEDKTFIKL